MSGNINTNKRNIPIVQPAIITTILDNRKELCYK